MDYYENSAQAPGKTRRKILLPLIICGLITVVYLYNLPQIILEMRNSLEYQTSATARIISISDSNKKPGFIKIRLRYYQNNKQYFSDIFEPGDTRLASIKVKWKKDSTIGVLVSKNDPTKIILNETLSLVQIMTLTFVVLPFIFGFICSVLEFILARDAMEIELGGVTIGKFFNITFFMTGIGIVIYIPVAWSIGHPFNWMIGLAYILIVLPVSWTIIYLNHHRKNRIKARKNENCFLPDYQAISENSTSEENPAETKK